MHPSALTLLLAAVVSAIVLPRFPRTANADTCCFNLVSVGRLDSTIQQDTIGELVILGDGFREGFFCMDKGSHRIFDGQGKACFVNPQLNQLKCHQPGISAPAGTFDWARNPANASDPNVYLAYCAGNETVESIEYLACPGDSPTTASAYEIFSTGKEDQGGCYDIELASLNGVGDCLP